MPPCRSEHSRGRVVEYPVTRYSRAVPRHGPLAVTERLGRNEHSGLVQKRQRLRRIPIAQLRGGTPDVTGQRPRQVRLVEVSKPVSNVMGWHALLDQNRRLPGTTDLRDGTAGEPGCRYEAPLDGALGHVCGRATKRSGDDRVTDQDTLTHHPPYETFGIVVIGQAPGGTIQPERPARRIGNLGRTIDKPVDRKM